jgi:ferrochelatase
MADSPTGVLLMSFGAAATPQDVPSYLERVRRAKPPPELVAEFQRRYRLVGGSPLVRNTWAQALALESLLESQEYARSSFRRKPESSAVTEKKRFTVSIGMRHTPPFIEEGFAQLVAKGVSQVVGVILSPQYSPYIMGGYHRALE